MIAIRSASSRIRKLPSNSRTKSTAQVPPPNTTAAEDSVPVGASLLAAIVGVAVVSVSAGAVETATSDSCLPYSSSGNAQRFDQSTFSGRFARMLLACDPALLLHTEATIQAAQQTLLEAEESSTSQSQRPQQQLSPLESRKLWEAKRIVEGALHPDTGEIIPRPFRMSGYVPYNGPICVSMVASTSTIPLLFWSWANQSQNALVNYYVSRVTATIILLQKIIERIIMLRKNGTERNGSILLTIQLQLSLCSFYFCFCFFSPILSSLLRTAMPVHP